MTEPFHCRCLPFFSPSALHRLLILALLLAVAESASVHGLAQSPKSAQEKEEDSAHSETGLPSIDRPEGVATEEPDEELAETRAERLIRKRRDRMDSIEPWKVKPLERAIRRAEEEVETATATAEATLAHHFLGMTPNPLFSLPTIGYRDRLMLQGGRIRTNSGLSMGLQYRDPKLGGRDLEVDVLAAASFRGYQFFNFRFGKIQLFPHSIFGPPPPELQRQRTAFFSYLDASYRKFTREEFFGLGNDSTRTNRSDYSFRQTSLDAVAGISHRRWLTVAGSAGIMHPRVGPGGDPGLINTELAFPDDPAVEFGRQPDFLRLAGTVLVDLRDRAGDPRRGLFAGASATRFDSLRTDRHGFLRFQGDGRGYLPLGAQSRVLAVRLFASADRPDSGAAVPFHQQQTLGGPHTLRGYPNFRFRGQKLLHLSAEYRWEIHPTVEGAAFYDTGRVYDVHEPLRFRHLKKSFGFGLRFKSPDVVFFRVELARSAETTRVQFIFGPSF